MAAVLKSQTLLVDDHPLFRAGLALAQGALWTGAHGDIALSDAPITHSMFGNPVVGEGPLGSEDKENLHF